MHATLSAAPPRQRAPRFFPGAPESIDAAGLNTAFVEDHMLRYLNLRPQSSGAQLAAACGLSFSVGIGGVLDSLRQDHLVEIRGQRGIGDAGFAYVLTSKGAARAAEAQERTQYQGPLPVSLADYLASVVAQPIDRRLVTPDRVREAFGDLLTTDSISDKIGPSINSGSALFLFGSPGNGKTVLAERIARVLNDPIYIPYAVEVDGTIVKLFDPVVHRPVECASTPGFDHRWVQVERPLVVAGGELTLAGLDLLWSLAGRFYEAPLQLKANGGVLLIDDFGRQQVRPRELLNRWIVPLEKHIDYLTLVTGKRIQVPFHLMLVFATNLHPNDLADDAFLRRIRFKLKLEDPTAEQFLELFRRECLTRGLTWSADGVRYMLDNWLADRPLRMCQPRDLVEQVVAIADYLGMEPDTGSHPLLDAACSSYFATAA